MILATKSGWLIACKLLRETPKAFIVEYTDDKGNEVRISKSDQNRKLFNSTDEAITWMDGE